MMRASLIAVVLSMVSAAVCAQPANETVTGLESCFQLTRAADAVCSEPENDAAQRLECLQRARALQLECLKKVLPETSAGSAPSDKTANTAAPPETPAGTASPELPPAIASPIRPATAAPPEKPTAAVSGEPAAANGTEKPAAAPEKAAATPIVLPKTTDLAPKPLGTNWVVSETTSPVDYTPLITAMIRLPVAASHAPNILAIRCRGRGTELLVRTGGSWRPSRAGEVPVEYQINDQPAVRLPWTASADGRTAIYKDDPIKLLRSLPEGARLKIDVLDGTNPVPEASFELAGLEAVREKLAAACKWPPVAKK
jgi:hypothetical protein